MSFASQIGKPTHSLLGEGRWHRERNGRAHTVYRRGVTPSEETDHVSPAENPSWAKAIERAGTETPTYREARPISIPVALTSGALSKMERGW